MSKIIKSVNLQYDTLGRLYDGTNESLTKRLMFQALFFFHDFLQNSLQKSFQFIFLFFHKIIKIKSFECPKSIKSIEKNNAWNIRLLDDNSLVPSFKQPSVIYCRLTDFWSCLAYLLSWPLSSEGLSEAGGTILPHILLRPILSNPPEIEIEIEI